MSRLTNRLERVERAARRIDPSSGAWRVCCRLPDESGDHAIARHRAQYGRGPVVVVPAKIEQEELQ